MCCKMCEFIYIYLYTYIERNFLGVSSPWAGVDPDIPIIHLIKKICVI
jgi:hypothetical protein